MIEVLPIFKHDDADPNGVYVNTTSSAGWSRDLSPFVLGPCPLYGGHVSRTMENGWQYSKVYYRHLGDDGLPTDEYLTWAKAGWDDPRAHRYPMGKGRKPAFSWWDGKQLSYVEARKRIYVPLYARAVMQTQGFARLRELLKQGDSRPLYLLDFDAYRHRALGMTLTDVLNDPTRKMGHAFVLMMLLTADPALRECET